LRKAKVLKTGVMKILKLTLNNGQFLKLTEDHKVLTTNGWKEAKDLIIGEEVLVQNGKTSFIDKDDIGNDLANSI